MAANKSVIGSNGRETIGNESTVEPVDSPISSTSTPPATAGNNGTGNGHGHFDDPTARRKRTTKAQKSDSSIELETPQVEAKPRKSKTKRKADPVASASPDSEATAAFLIDTVQLFASAKFGESGLFSMEERWLIESPLARIVERYGSAVKEYSPLLDPLMLGIGLVMYGGRLVAAARKSPAPATGAGDSPAPEPEGIPIPEREPVDMSEFLQQFGSKLS